MQVLLTLAGAMLAPLAAFGLLLWLAHLEETLPQDVQRAQRQPAPPPILAIPVRTVAPAQPVLIPEQRPAPTTERPAPTTELSGPGGYSRVTR